MPVAREATLKKAEKLLRQGKLADAIAEYARLVADYPRDWNTINTLGDLYVRAGDVDRAVDRFTIVADHLYGEGFLPRAAAVYKKALKARPDHDHTLSRLAAIAASQGLTADARAYLRDLSRQRADRGDRPGVDECDARLAALAEGEPDAKAQPEAEAAPEPEPVVESVAESPAVADTPAVTDAAAVAEAMPAVQSAAADESGASDPGEDAAPSATPADLALARLDRAIEGGDEREIREAQAELTDIYLEAGQGVEARILAADLVSQEPDSLAHAERLKWAHELLGTRPPESIADPVADLTSHDANASEPVVVRVEAETAEVAGIEAIFEKFRADVAEEHRTLAAEQYERGVKKMEEGKLAEAIQDLQAATRTPVRRFIASASLGRKLAADGELRVAVEWLEQAAGSLPPNADERRALLYDLADTLERLGERDRALTVLHTLEKDAGDYWDVRDRIARLSRSQRGSAKA